MDAFFRSIHVDANDLQFYHFVTQRSKTIQKTIKILVRSLFCVTAIKNEEEHLKYLRVVQVKEKKSIHMSNWFVRSRSKHCSQNLKSFFSPLFRALTSSFAVSVFLSVCLFFMSVSPQSRIEPGRGLDCLLIQSKSFQVGRTTTGVRSTKPILEDRQKK